MLRHMTGTDPDHQDAIAIVEWVLGVAASPVGGDGQDDYRLTGGDGTIGTLGLGVARTPLWLTQPSLVIPAPALTRSWLLYHPPSAEILCHLRTVVDILGDLDAAGVGALDAPRSQPGVGAAVRSLGRFGVLRAMSLDQDPGEAVISFAPPPYWLAAGHSPSHLVNDAVEDEIWAGTGARRWDGSAPCLERHMFIWVDPADLGLRAAMEADCPPAAPIRPGNVDVVWVARHAPRRSGLLADRIWQTGADGEWEPLAPVRRSVRPLAAVAAPG